MNINSITFKLKKIKVCIRSYISKYCISIIYGAFEYILVKLLFLKCAMATLMTIRPVIDKENLLKFSNRYAYLNEIRINHKL